MLPFIFKENVDDDLSIEEEIYDENNNSNDNESKSFLISTNSTFPVSSIAVSSTVKSSRINE